MSQLYFHWLTIVHSHAHFLQQTKTTSWTSVFICCWKWDYFRWNVSRVTLQFRRWKREKKERWTHPTSIFYIFCNRWWWPSEKRVYCDAKSEWSNFFRMFFFSLEKTKNTEEDSCWQFCTEDKMPINTKRKELKKCFVSVQLWWVWRVIFFSSILFLFWSVILCYDSKILLIFLIFQREDRINVVWSDIYWVNEVIIHWNDQ